jgi:hypothetical protein
MKNGIHLLYGTIDITFFHLREKSQHPLQMM